MAFTTFPPKNSYISDTTSILAKDVPRYMETQDMLNELYRRGVIKRIQSHCDFTDDESRLLPASEVIGIVSSDLFHQFKDFMSHEGREFLGFSGGAKPATRYRMEIFVCMHPDMVKKKTP